jgi:predicted ATPase
MPPTLQALLAARIDRLDADERAVLVRGAVEGRTFHRGAVAEPLPESGRPLVGARLISLVR